MLPCVRSGRQHLRGHAAAAPRCAATCESLTKHLTLYCPGPVVTCSLAQRWSFTHGQVWSWLVACAQAGLHHESLRCWWLLWRRHACHTWRVPFSCEPPAKRACRLCLLVTRPASGIAACCIASAQCHILWCACVAMGGHERHLQVRLLSRARCAMRRGSRPATQWRRGRRCRAGNCDARQMADAEQC